MVIYAPDTIFHFAVDHRMSLTEMISAGNYSEVDPDIHLDRYVPPCMDVVECEATLASFCIKMSQHDVLHEVREQYGNSWKQADIFQLLSFGEKFPDEQCEGAIFALAENPHDKRWDSFMSKPALSSFGLYNALRKLELVYGLGGIPAHTRFLLVRQVNT